MSTYTTPLGGTVTFTASADSWSEQSGSEVNVIGFPGGDAIAVSIAGQRETTRTFKALLANKAAFDQLKDMGGKAGWLQVTNWDSVPVNAVLKQITPDPIQTDGQVYAQVQFVLY
jgi:alpha/beta superfamily hydrolase